MLCNMKPARILRHEPTFIFKRRLGVILAPDGEHYKPQDAICAFFTRLWTSETFFGYNRRRLADTRFE